MIKVKFELKNGGIKEVNVDFFSTDYLFSNHLKRCVCDQITGSNQKTHLLHLVNKGLFTVINDETNEELYQKPETSFDSNTGITHVNTTSRSSLVEDAEDVEEDKLNLEEICDELYSTEAKIIRLHYILQSWNE